MKELMAQAEGGGPCQSLTTSSRQTLGVHATPVNAYRSDMTSWSSWCVRHQRGSPPPVMLNGGKFTNGGRSPPLGRWTMGKTARRLREMLGYLCWQFLPRRSFAP